ncbi:22523_t:CDS:2, partial [Gigaspora rosea]
MRKELFETADQIAQTLSTTSKKHPQAVFSSRSFKYSNLPKSVNSSNSYEYHNSDMQDIEISD